MAKAWVDNGADAYVGAWIAVEADTDDEMRVFWNDLCQLNTNVQTAVSDMIDEHGYEWDGRWKIYGDKYAILQN